MITLLAQNKTAIMSLVQKKQLLLVNVNGTKVRQEASSLVHKQELAINVVTMKSISYFTVSGYMTDIYVSG